MTPMKKKPFNQLLQGVHELGAALKGNKGAATRRTLKLSFTDLPTTFDADLHPPRPIRNKADYDKTARIVDVLAIAGTAPTKHNLD